jgi:hypothetical protein
MDVILDFNFKLDKNLVSKTLKSYFELITDEEINNIYDKLFPALHKLVEPVGIFKIDKKTENLTFDVLRDCNYIVYCIITIGDKCTEKLSELFLYGQLKEAMVLDAMATSYLFEISSQLFSHICNKASKLNLGLSHRIAPGDGEIPLSYQKNILDKLEAGNFLGIHILDNYMLSSEKSMAYIYGADIKLKLSKVDHNCSNCPNQNYCIIKK